VRRALLASLCVVGLGVISPATAAEPETTLGLKTRSQDQALDQGAIVVHVKTNQPTTLHLKAAFRPGSIDRKFELKSTTETIDGNANIRFALKPKPLEALAADASSCTVSRVTYSALHASSGIKTTVRARLDRRPDC
jgi:hypothetical protein